MPKSAVEDFEVTFFNNMALLLDYMFVHRLTGIEGKDGNPLNEARVICNSLLASSPHLQHYAAARNAPAALQGPARPGVGDLGDDGKGAFPTGADLHNLDLAFVDESQDLTAEGLVRVSTLHSSKGVDFPVVLLYLPSMPTDGEYDENSADSLERNLIYVAMTRAMNTLNVFAMEGAKERAVTELVGAISALRDGCLPACAGPPAPHA
jgi:hypothetical protein